MDTLLEVLRVGLAITVAFAVMIAVHEAGHLIAAKLCGVYAPAFSIGFGPVLFRKKYGETEYCLSLLPLGGYVKIAGERDEGDNPDAVPDSRLFTNQSILKRAFIIIAGVTCNMICALTLCIMLAATVGVRRQPVVIGSLIDDMPAKAAGLVPGDQIVTVDSIKTPWFDDFTAEIAKKGGRKITLGIVRDGQGMLVELSPHQMQATNLFKQTVTTWGVGVVIDHQKVEQISYSPLGAVAAGADVFWYGTKNTAIGIWKTISGELGVQALSGPVGIGKAIQDFATSIAALVGIIVMLNISLAFCNMLPIPALDGGMLFSLVIEAVLGRKAGDTYRKYATPVGVAFIICLAVGVTALDIWKIATGTTY